MRLLITIGGGMVACFLCEAMSKTIGYYYLHQNLKPASVTNAWLVVACTFLALVASLVLLYRAFGRIFRWREHHFPNLSETIMTVVFLPVFATSLGGAFMSATQYGQDRRVPVAATFGFHFLILLLTMIITTMLFTLVRDLLLVRRLGWTQIAQMEAARLKEESAGR